MSQSLEVSNKKALVNLLDSDPVKNRLKEILGKNSATFATSIVQIQSQNKMLAECTPNSILGAAMTAVTLNLPLNNQLGQAYIVPFREKQSDGTWLTKAQFMLGYKGLLQLCTRSGTFKFNNAREVKEGEIKYFDYMTGEIEFEWEQDYDKRSQLKTVGYMHYYELLSGFKSTKFMSVQELDSHGKRFSKTYAKGFGNWKDDFHSMCMKTVTKLHLNAGDAPLSIDVQTAIIKDQATVEINEEGEESQKYIDNVEDVKVDHDKERQLTLINSIKTLEDLEFAEAHVTDPTLIPVLQAKKIQFNKQNDKQ